MFLILFFLTCLQCLNVTQLLMCFGFAPNSPITHTVFTYLCPALLYQIDKRHCIDRYDDLVIEEFGREKNASLGNADKTGATGEEKYNVKKKHKNLVWKTSCYCFSLVSVALC